MNICLVYIKLIDLIFLYTVLTFWFLYIWLVYCKLVALIFFTVLTFYFYKNEHTQSNKPPPLRNGN